jgi:hypothetical protein
MPLPPMTPIPLLSDALLKKHEEFHTEQAAARNRRPVPPASLARVRRNGGQAQLVDSKTSSLHPVSSMSGTSPPPDASRRDSTGLASQQRPRSKATLRKRGLTMISHAADMDSEGLRKRAFDPAANPDFVLLGYHGTTVSSLPMSRSCDRS